MSNRAISTELIELGERIRKRRQEMKLSQESFAEKAGISVNTVSRMEGDTERQESVQEVLYQIQKLEWKEQKIIMQTIDSLIDSFNEYR